MRPKLLATALGVCLGVVVILELPGDPPPAVSTPERVPRSVGTDGRIEPGELLVRFARSARASDRSRLREDADTDLKRPLPLQGLQLLEVERGQSVRGAVSELERSRAVVYAEPNFRRSVSLVPSDPYFGHEWGLHNTGQAFEGGAGTPDADIDAPETWDTTTGGAGATVAVVDSGVDLDHPDLRGNVWTNAGERGDGRETNGIDDDGNGLRDDSRGWDWVDSDNLPSDANGHGTHVAGTIAARGGNGLGVAGVSWASRVMPLRVLDAEGSGTVADAVSAYRYAAANGARVVNASLGGDSYSRAESDAIASASGTLFVVAAGNGGSDGVGDDNDATPEYPCGHTAPNLICVAASDRRDRLADFSNYGASSVDLAAPGVEILSTRRGNGFAFLDGTSMATPHVAGAAALMLSLPASEGAPSVPALRSALLGGVETKPAFTGRTATGGRLNLARALSIMDPKVPVEVVPPAPSAGPGTTPGVAATPRPATRADTTPPPVTLTVRRRQGLRVVLRQGLRIRAACSEACSLSARLVVPASAARRLRLTRSPRSVVAARASRPLATGGVSLRVRFSARARRGLRRARGVRAKIRVLARDATGNLSRLDRAVVLRR